MANRYWIGGTGNWSDTTHWSATSGGEYGASVPTSKDDVFFDVNSFSRTWLQINQLTWAEINNMTWAELEAPLYQTVNVDINAVCKDMDWTGATGYPILGGSGRLDVYGEFISIPEMTISLFNFYLTAGNCIALSNFYLTSGNCIATAELQINSIVGIIANANIDGKATLACNSLMKEFQSANIQCLANLITNSLMKEYQSASISVSSDLTCNTVVGIVAYSSGFNGLCELTVDSILGIIASTSLLGTTSFTCWARLKPEPLLAEIKTHLVKIEWLTWDESQVTGEYTSYALDGNIDIDTSNDIRRTFRATFLNNKRLFIPNGSLTNMGVKLRIYRGIVTTYGQKWWPKGVFVLNDPEAAHNNAENTVTLQGLDKWALLDGSLGGTLIDTYQIPKGTNVATAIRGVLAVTGETKFRFNECNTLVPYTITKQPGETFADLLKELALIPSYELFYDEEGYMVFRPMIDPVNKPISYDFVTKYRKLYVGGTYKPEWSKIKNKWKVIGYSDSGTGITYSGVAEDNNPNSPTNTAMPPNGIGIKAEVITDTNLTSNELCATRATYELNKNLKSWHRITAVFDFVPFLKEGDCILLKDDSVGIDGKYEIQSINEPLGLGQYTVEAWRVIA